jgi:hypothetical protein
MEREDRFPLPETIVGTLPDAPVRNNRRGPSQPLRQCMPALVDFPVRVGLWLWLTWRKPAMQLLSQAGTGREQRPQRRKLMTTFDEREKSFEKKFAMDQELRFKAESRRNKMLAEWAGSKLGLTGPELDDYTKAVRKADLAEKGDEDVFRKIRKDFDAKGVPITDSELRLAIVDFLAKAIAQIEQEGKGK